MGYHTELKGSFRLDRQMDPAHAAYLRKFASIRHMKRNPVLLKDLPDPLRRSIGLPIGEQGMFFTGDAGPSLDQNSPPVRCPGLWCQWVPTPNDDGIEWDGREKFDNYVEWIQLIITEFLVTWGYKLNGKVHWQGEESEDRGTIMVKDNVISLVKADDVLPESDVPVGTIYLSDTNNLYLKMPKGRSAYLFNLNVALSDGRLQVKSDDPNRQVTVWTGARLLEALESLKG